MGAEESTGDHRAPAAADWPSGFGESSLWPIVTGLGAAGIYAGAALALLGRGERAIVSPLLAPAVLVPGVGLFLAGLYGWTYQGFVARYRSRVRGSNDALRWGMVLFLVTDVTTFAAGFVYYFFVRTGAWPPGELPALLSPVVAVNTAALLASSATMHAAHGAVRGGRRRRFLLWLGATLALGVVFVAGQLVEYADVLAEEGLSVTGVFTSAFFALTGLHGLHVALGVVLIATVLVRGLRGQFSAERHTAVTTVSMYWHFVDVVWIFLVATLYVGAVA